MAPGTHVTKLCVAFIISWISVCHAQAVFEVDLPTRLGNIQGTRDASSNSPGRYFYSFKGIPYAQPPVGDLRWEDPLPSTKWQGTLQAKEFRPICPQYVEKAAKVDGDEDCLYLNVFTPFLPKDKGTGSGAPSSSTVTRKNKLPVMVWIHGGGYYMGSSNFYGADKLMAADIVLVTINYRVGALGFLSSGCEVLPGNYGMLDQLMALKWVQNNIIDYNGDPHKVTLFGESAGGSAVHYHVLSELSAGYFHRAIIQSGNALCNWAFRPDPWADTEKIAEDLECSSSSADSVKECLKNKSPEELVQAQMKFLKDPNNRIQFAPVIDSEHRKTAFLKQRPVDIITSGNYTKVPILTGINKDEGLFFYVLLHLENFEKMNDTDFLKNELISNWLSNSLRNADEIEIVTEAVIRRYFDFDLSNKRLFIPRFIQVISDVGFMTCHADMVKLHTDTSNDPLYSYIFSYRDSQSPSFSDPYINQLQLKGIRHPLFKSGVGHVDETLYLFTLGSRDKNFSPSTNDREMTRSMVNYWTSFADRGKPEANPAYQRSGNEWVPTRRGQTSYYNITLVKPQMESDFRDGEYQFWKKTIPYVQELGEDITELSPYYIATWVLLGLCILFLLLFIIFLSLYIRKGRSQSYPESITLATATSKRY